MTGGAFHSYTSALGSAAIGLATEMNDSSLLVLTPLKLSCLVCKVYPAGSYM